MTGVPKGVQQGDDAETVSKKIKTEALPKPVPVAAHGHGAPVTTSGHAVAAAAVASRMNALNRMVPAMVSSSGGRGDR